MAQTLYRDYSQWLTAMEPRLRWVHLTRPQFRMLAAVVGLIFLATALLLVSRMAVIKNGYAILELRQEKERLTAQHRMLERKVKDLASLARTEEVARRDMGMVDVDPNQVIYLEDGKAKNKGFFKSLFGG